MNFVANFTCFPVVQKFENRLRFDKITESLKVGTFLRHSVYTSMHCYKFSNLWFERSIISCALTQTSPIFEYFRRRDVLRIVAAVSN